MILSSRNFSAIPMAEGTQFHIGCAGLSV